MSLRETVNPMEPISTPQRKPRWFHDWLTMTKLIRRGWRQVPLPNEAGVIYVKAGSHGKVYVEHTMIGAKHKQIGLDWAAGNKRL